MDAQIALKDCLERSGYGPNPKPAPFPGGCILSCSYSYQRTVLKTVMGGNLIVGSNPTPSASIRHEETPQTEICRISFLDVLPNTDQSINQFTSSTPDLTIHRQWLD